jgi:hypothetical protein
MTRLKLGLLLCLITNAALAAGFDDRYTVATGDLNSDGQTDIYLKYQPRIAIIDADGIAIPIAVARRLVGEFALLNQGNGTFARHALSAAELALVKQWPQGDLRLRVRDMNFDGNQDVQIEEFSDSADTTLSSAFDVMVFASATEGAQPAQVASMTPDKAEFFAQAFAWSLDPSWFDKNAPLKITGSLPPNGHWYGGALAYTADVLPAISKMLSQCQVGTVFVCGASATAPAGCSNMPIVAIDDFGQDIGQVVQKNVCSWGVHVYQYPSNTQVTVAHDYSVFNQQARQYRTIIIDGIPGGVPDAVGKDPSQDPLKSVNEGLDGLIRQVVGQEEPGDGPTSPPPGYYTSICEHRAGKNHNAHHEPLPFDSLFSPLSPTYHHYDVQSKACDIADPLCTVSDFENTALRRFTYPSFKLQPKLTMTDGTWYMAYVADPWGVSKPGRYVFPIGWISQSNVVTGQFYGAVVNETQSYNDELPFEAPAHFLYPGRISRKTIGASLDGLVPGPFIFTHGIGENRYTTASVAWGGEILSPVINQILACVNDLQGPEAFKTLDKQATKWFRQYVGTQTIPQGTATVGRWSDALQ